MEAGEIPRREPELMAMALIGIIVQPATARLYGRLEGGLLERADEIVAMCWRACRTSKDTAMSASPIGLLKTRRLWPLALAQSCGALNDNLVKNAMVVLALFQLGIGGAGLSALAGALFIAPYFCCRPRRASWRTASPSRASSWSTRWPRWR